MHEEAKCFRVQQKRFDEELALWFGSFGNDRGNATPKRAIGLALHRLPYCSMPAPIATIYYDLHVAYAVRSSCHLASKCIVDDHNTPETLKQTSADQRVAHQQERRDVLLVADAAETWKGEERRGKLENIVME